MSELRSCGWVGRDLEFKRSQKGSLYVRFTLVEHLGYGEASRKQYYEVWAWNEVAQSLLDQRIGKGSRIRVQGFLELVDYMHKDGKTRDKKLKLRLREWRPWEPGKYTGPPMLGETEDPQVCQSPGPVPVVDGEREPLPE